MSSSGLSKKQRQRLAKAKKSQQVQQETTVEDGLEHDVEVEIDTETDTDTASSTSITQPHESLTVTSNSNPIVNQHPSDSDTSKPTHESEAQPEHDPQPAVASKPTPQPQSSAEQVGAAAATAPESTHESPTSTSATATASTSTSTSMHESPAQESLSTSHIRVDTNNNDTTSSPIPSISTDSQPAPPPAYGSPQSEASLSPSASTSPSPSPTPSPTSSTSTTTNTSRQDYLASLERYHTSMSQTSIPRDVVNQHVFLYGVPDQTGARSLMWKLLLGLLPYDRSQWESTLASTRAHYESFVKELTTNPFAKLDQELKDKSPDAAKWTQVRPEDDPLNQRSTEWKQYYKDQEIRDEIEKDVKRTYSTFNFFNQRVRPLQEDSPRTLKKINAPKPTTSLFDEPPPVKDVPVVPTTNVYSSHPPKRKEDESHHDVIQRILFIYAKLNPGVRYVQGMNEVLAPIYFIFAQDKDPLFQYHAESDAFICFTNLMAEVRDRFIKSLDNSSTGIITVVKELNDLLQSVDYELWKHLDNLGVDPRFYSFRWITLMLSQEFELPEVLRLWDSFFADPKRFQFLLYTCCAMMISVRDIILNGDFADALKILQRFPPMDHTTLLKTAHMIRQKILRRVKPTVEPSAVSLPIPIISPAKSDTPLDSDDESDQVLHINTTQQPNTQRGGKIMSFIRKTAANIMNNDKDKEKRNTGLTEYEEQEPVEDYLNDLPHPLARSTSRDTVLPPPSAPIVTATVPVVSPTSSIPTTSSWFASSESSLISSSSTYSSLFSDTVTSKLSSSLFDD